MTQAITFSFELPATSAIKHFGVERYKKNCLKANEGFAWALDKMYRSSSRSASKCPQSQDTSSTEIPAYSDTLGTQEKCHCKQMSL